MIFCFQLRWSRIGRPHMVSEGLAGPSNQWNKLRKRRNAMSSSRGRPRPPPDHSCPPSSFVFSKRVVGAGVGVGMLRGRGILLVEIKNLIVSKILGFLVYWLLGLKVPKFQWPTKHLIVLKFTDPISPHFHLMFCGRYSFHIQDFKEFPERLFMIIRCFFSSIFCCFHFQHVRFRNYFFKNELDEFSNSVEYPGVSKDQSSWFWESWARPEIRKSCKW